MGVKQVSTEKLAVANAELVALYLSNRDHRIRVDEFVRLYNCGALQHPAIMLREDRPFIVLEGGHRLCAYVLLKLSHVPVCAPD